MSSVYGSTQSNSVLWIGVLWIGVLWIGVLWIGVLLVVAEFYCIQQRTRRELT